MSISRWIGLLASASLAMALAACKSDSTGAGGGGAGGGAGTGGEVAIGALTHCDKPVHHCLWPSGLFSCAEYADADAATYQSLCTSGGGTWAAGYCAETSVLGQCLPLNYCKGMGIGFTADAASEADAKQSCSDTGGTWQTPKP